MQQLEQVTEFDEGSRRLESPCKQQFEPRKRVGWHRWCAGAGMLTREVGEVQAVPTKLEKLAKGRDFDTTDYVKQEMRVSIVSFC